MNFFKKIKTLERKHLHELSMLCGAAAVLLLVAGFVASGIPSKTYAWIITVSASYTPVVTGGNSTVSWSAPTSDSCYIQGPPNISNSSCSQVCTVTGSTCSGGGGSLGPPPSCTPTYGPPCSTVCSASVNGASGSEVVGPINGNTTYNVACINVSGGIGSSQGSGGTYITVVPTAVTPTTLNSFSATPASVASGGVSSLSYSATAGTYGTGLKLVGGIYNGMVTAYGGGAWSGSLSTGALTSSTVYNMYTEDTHYGELLGAQITVPVVSAPVTASVVATTPVSIGQSATITFSADSTIAPSQCQIEDSTNTTVLKNVTTCATGANTVSFTTPGTTTWTVPAGITSIDALLVAGGGGGAGGAEGGGGGGGGVLQSHSLAVTPGQVLTVVVGSGGTSGTNGGNSSIVGLATAVGGGAGGGEASPGNAGGSGGGAGGDAGAGAGGTATAGQGTAGGVGSNGTGRRAGGGGGASTAGGSGLANGGGGSGLAVSSEFGGGTYGGGGGGALEVAFGAGTGGTGGGGGGGTACSNGATNANGNAGTANTGGGGGAGGRCGSNTSSAYTGGTGGSGIVKITYNNTYTTPVYTNPGIYAYNFWYDQSGTWTKAQTVNVTVTAPAPSCTISASPSGVNFGSTTALNYTTTNATGASIDQGVGAVGISTFTSSGTWTVPVGVTSVQYLVVGGGGGGAGVYGGGGGGGGVLTGTLTVTPGTPMTVTVGAGGAGGVSASGSNGGNSIFGSITAVGGGGGARAGATAGSGGSGGGAGYYNGGTSLSGSGTAGQGTAGGAGSVTSGVGTGGGGGGAGSTGGAAAGNVAGNGGPGIASSVSGSSVFYGGGGGGGAPHTAGVGGNGGGGSGALNSVTASSGAANTGGGGGGSGNPGTGGNGGSGIVILSYYPSGSVQSTAVTSSPTAFTMTVTGLGGTNACNTSVTINDVCTDISGFQSTLPPGCTGPTPSPSGVCIPSGYYYNYTSSSCQVIVPPPVTISAFFGPVRVRSGSTASLKYTVTNPPASCTITGTNGYNSGSISPVSGVQGSVTTTAVTKNTAFTLTCGTVSLSTSVGITPSFQEQ